MTSTDKKQYAFAVGNIAIEWNLLEFDLQQLGFAYLTVEEDVASHIFAFMGNVTKVEFIDYLVNHFEKNREIKSHIQHFLKLFNRLRGNRNVVEHGIPSFTKSGAYLEKIIKMDRRGDPTGFAATQAELEAFLFEIKSARNYAHTIKKNIDPMRDDRDEYIDIADLEKPDLPKRLGVIK